MDSDTLAAIVVIAMDFGIGMLASRVFNRRGVLWFFLSFFFSPILMLPLLLLMGRSRWVRTQ